MNKKWFGIVCMLVLAPFFSASCAAADSTVLEIDAIDEGWLVGVASYIRNVGDIAAEDVEWSISITGGSVFVPRGGIRSGVVSSISAGEEKNIFSGPVFGFGGVLSPLEITVSACAANAEPVSLTETGWMFFFILQV